MSARVAAALLALALLVASAASAGRARKPDKHASSGPGAPLPAPAAPVSPKLAHPWGISDPSGSDCAQPRLASTPDGAVLMSWLAKRKKGGSQLRLAAYKDGRWSPSIVAVEGDSFVVNGADFPSVCAFGPHGIAVAWGWKRAGDATDAFVSVSADGGGEWSAPRRLHDDHRGTVHGFVSLAPQGAGVRAAWLDGHNLAHGEAEGEADMTLHSRFVAPNGLLAREQEVDSRVCDCCPIAAGVAGATCVIAYRDRGAGDVRDIARVRLDSGRWLPPAIVRRDGWTLHGCPVNGPALATAGDRVAVAWFTAASDTARVYVEFSPDGGHAFGAATRVDDGRPIGRPGVALLDDGVAVVSWLEADKGRVKLRARAVREGAKPGEAVTVAEFSGAAGVGLPQVALAGSRVLFAWTEPGKFPRIRVSEVKL